MVSALEKCLLRPSCFMAKPFISFFALNKKGCINTLSEYIDGCVHTLPDNDAGVVCDSTGHYGFSSFDNTLVLWGGGNPGASCGNKRKNL